MRQYTRPDLNKRTVDYFTKATTRIKRKRKFQTKVAEAKRLWDNHKCTSARIESVAKLLKMNGELMHCMYCEHDQAIVMKNGKQLAIVDHWQPRSNAPERTFDWTNHFLACKRCNMDLKGADFPTDSAGQPLLIHPVNDNPLNELEYHPSSGDFKELTAKGKETIDKFQLNDFSDRRKLVWNFLLVSLREYDTATTQGDTIRANDIKANWLKLQDFRSILHYFVKIALSPSGDYLTGPGIPDIIRRHDPIATWR
jgi:uncharacterized protein (TIGR02646 family)